MTTRSKTTGKTIPKSTTDRKAKSAAKTNPPKPSVRANPPKAAVTAKVADVAKAAVVLRGDAQISGPELKKRELVDLVVERSGEKKKYVKPAVEAMLAVLGEAIAEGRELILPPMGKVKYKRTKEAATNRVVIANIRQRKEPIAVSDLAKDTVAEPAE